MGDNDFGICPDMLTSVSNEIKDVVNLGVELCLVIGGGNIYRGITGVSKGMDRTTGDNMGMLATVMNSLALQNSLEKLGILQEYNQLYLFQQFVNLISEEKPTDI